MSIMDKTYIGRNYFIYCQRKSPNIKVPFCTYVFTSKFLRCFKLHIPKWFILFYFIIIILINFSKADSNSRLVKCTSTLGNLQVETNFVWPHVVQTQRVRKKFFYIMNVVFWLLLRVFKVTMKYTTLLI